MKKIFLLSSILFTAFYLSAQKKPLDHTVYDSWQTLGERAISNDGKFVVYTITPQEGDATMYIQQTDGKKLLEIPRGYNVKITEDNKYVVFRIKPTLKQTKSEARGGRGAAPVAPAGFAGRGGGGGNAAGSTGSFKDSLGIVEIATLKLDKIPRIKSYKIPEKTSGLLVYLLDKPVAENAGRMERDSLSRVKAIEHTADSLAKVVDSLRNKLTEVQTKGLIALRPQRSNTPTTPTETVDEGTELVVLDLNTKTKYSYKLVSDYTLSKTGNKLLIKTTKKNGDATSKASVLQLTVASNKIDTLLKGFNDAKNFSFDDEGNQIAFVAERDSAKKESQKFYKLYYYKPGYDTAVLIADKATKGVPAKWLISEYANLTFSKSGKRLFLGTAPIIPPKDTTLPESERVSVDVWNYKDDDLMTVQLKNLEQDLRQNYSARYDFETKSIIQLADEKFERILQTSDGDGDVFYAASDFGKRVQRQWQGYSLSDLYAVNPVTGEKTLIIKDVKARPISSYTGKYLVWYDEKKKEYAVYNNATKKVNAVAKDITVPLYDEENDVPDDPNGYGIVKWMEGDKYVLMYDKYDVWKVDPDAKEKSVVITNGRKDKTQFRYVTLDNEEKFIQPEQKLYFRVFGDADKTAGIATIDLKSKATQILFKEKVAIGFGFVKAKDADELLFSKETYENSPNLYAQALSSTQAIKLSSTNPQQSTYVWGTAELFKWKAYTGKETEGILYKPENFDAKKKYPMIVYFYERNNNTLYNYQAPAPTPSRLNIPFFVSRGYVVFVPDIWYTTGHPGKSAYDYIVSGTRALIKQGFIDSTKLGLQGQSWGGYQTAYLITQTNLFSAAWAGAPVVNMFSAYGGIRWESGSNRQMQYEHGQSRIGSTIWEKSNLYVENSPLFHLQKVKTPLVIMSNDNDGAVPWYQGIEFFTAMRRLNKPVWLLNYNGEQHNLVERKNRKDISIREQQFFDWLLKGDKAPKWITDGVPATMKGRDWGFSTE
jgi:dipeptidyl aminopeptidase/acylaminoacyl peptidase